jgi:hypothetical protein
MIYKPVGFFAPVPGIFDALTHTRSGRDGRACRTEQIDPRCATLPDLRFPGFSLNHHAAPLPKMVCKPVNLFVPARQILGQPGPTRFDCKGRARRTEPIDRWGRYFSGVVARGRAGPAGTGARGLDGVGGLGLEAPPRAQGCF